MEPLTKDELGDAIVVFGLEAQGHLPTIEKMLAENQSWPAIGLAIGWQWETAQRHYMELYEIPKLRAALADMTRQRDEARELLKAAMSAWSFDDAQQHTHTWHDRENWAEQVYRLAFAEQWRGVSIGPNTEHPAALSAAGDGAGRVAELEAIVSRLPKTADGKPMPFRGIIWYDNSDRSLTYRLSHKPIVETMVESLYTVGRGSEILGLLEPGSSVCATGKISHCYSTRAAAEAAIEARGERGKA